MNLLNKIWFTLFFFNLVERSIQEVESHILEKILDYHSSNVKTLLPPLIKKNGTSNESAIIDVNIFLRSIDEIDDKNMEMKTQIILRMMWLDSRLSYQHLEEIKKEAIDHLELTDTSKIWIPDIFFANEKQAYVHNIVQPNTFIKIFPNGTVLYSKRLSITQSCPMNLRTYPFDSQICKIRLSTYKSTTNNVLLRWRPYDAVQIPKNIVIFNFCLKHFQNTEKIVQTTTGKYSLLEVDLTFNREFYYYVKKYYIPAVIIVLISWIPFWLERVLILRIYIAIPTVIFLAWHNVIQEADLLISYSTSVDSWNVANFIFVSLAALESILIIFMIKTNRNLIKRTHPDDSDEFKMLPCPEDKRKVLEIIDEKTDIDAEIMKIKTNFKICFINVHKEVQIIDAVAKLFFPSAYVLFLFFYWISF